MAIPTVIIVAPMIGFGVGYWVDGKLGSSPYLMILGIILGFGAAARETYQIIKRYQALEEKKDQQDDGT